MTRAKNDHQNKYLSSKEKVSVELNFWEIDDLLKAHLESFDRAHYEKNALNASHFAAYLHTTRTLIRAFASHPVNKEDNS